MAVHQSVLDSNQIRKNMFITGRGPVLITMCPDNFPASEYGVLVDFLFVVVLLTRTYHIRILRLLSGQENSADKDNCFRFCCLCSWS
jgi:hypothetical protein